MGEGEQADPFAAVVTATHVYRAVVDVGHQVVGVDHKVDLLDGKVDGVVATVADLQSRVRDLEANRWPRTLPTLFAGVALLVAIVGLWLGIA